MIIEVEAMIIEVKVMIIEVQAMIIEVKAMKDEVVYIQIETKHVTEIDPEVGTANLPEDQITVMLLSVGKDHRHHQRKNRLCPALAQLCQGQVVIPVLTTL